MTDLIRRDPFGLFASSPREWVGGGRLFDDFFGSARRTPSARVPALNLSEGEGAYELEVELPGVTLEDIELTVEGKLVELKGQRRTREADDESGSREYRERSFGSFARKLELPTEIDGDNVEARLTDGVLFVNLPKAKAALARRIQVQSREG